MVSLTNSSDSISVFNLAHSVYIILLFVLAISSVMPSRWTLILMLNSYYDILLGSLVNFSNGIPTANLANSVYIILLAKFNPDIWICWFPQKHLAGKLHQSPCWTWLTLPMTHRTRTHLPQEQNQNLPIGWYSIWQLILYGVPAGWQILNLFLWQMFFCPMCDVTPMSFDLHAGHGWFLQWSVSGRFWLLL